MLSELSGKSSEAPCGGAISPDRTADLAAEGWRSNSRHRREIRRQSRGTVAADTVLPGDDGVLSVEEGDTHAKPRSERGGPHLPVSVHVIEPGN